MPCLSSLEYPDGLTCQKFLSEQQMLDAIFSLRRLSSFTQTSFESRKFTWLRILLTALCLCTSLFRKLSKECKHTRDSTRMWVTLDSCQINNSPTPLIPLDVLLYRRPLWALRFSTTTLQLKMYERWANQLCLALGPL